MLYHPKEHIVSKIVKLIAFWASIFVMFSIILSLLIGDPKIKQRVVEMDLELKDHINICLPEEEDVHFMDF
ncbi:MAG: hypothetical protein ISQ34_05720 [Rickettsiales bacterium]|nr:hypothetical protein [Rickettsiales bacterium]